MSRDDAPVDEQRASVLRQAFAADLVPDNDSPWRTAFAMIARHHFVPSFQQQLPDGTWTPIHHGEPGYLEALYSDAALTTQLDARGVPTSSSSQPSVMLAMLEALSVEAGVHVLELGTGTGYNLALLAQRLGDAHLTSIDPDRALTDTARQRLQQAGYQPHIVTGNGLHGYPPRAPYDRIISTVALTHIPPALREQAAPQAILVAPLGYGIVRLICDGRGGGKGRFLPTPAYFMGTRAPAQAPLFDLTLQTAPITTPLTPHDILTRLQFPLSLALPGYTSCSWRDDDGRIRAAGLWLPDGSTITINTEGQARQAGPHPLLPVVEELAKRFGRHIAREDFTVAVTRQEQRVRYEATNGLHWNLPA